MTMLSKRIIVLLFVTALLAVVSIGCNTGHGFGKDVSAAGQGIQNGTKVTTARRVHGSIQSCAVCYRTPSVRLIGRLGGWVLGARG